MTMLQQEVPAQAHGVTSTGRHGLARGLVNIAKARWKALKSAVSGMRRWDRAGNGVGRQTYLQPQIDEPIQVQIFHLVLLHNCRAMMLARQDQEEFEANSQHSLHEALSGITAVKLQVQDERDLQSINYMKQVGLGLTSEGPRRVCCWETRT